MNYFPLSFFQLLNAEKQVPMLQWGTKSNKHRLAAGTIHLAKLSFCFWLKVYIKRVYSHDNPYFNYAWDLLTFVFK